MLEDLDLSVTHPPPPGAPPTARPVVSLTRFSWATSLFYFGALTGIVPAAFLCQKLPIAKFLSVMVSAVTATGVQPFEARFKRRRFEEAPPISQWRCNLVSLPADQTTAVVQKSPLRHSMGSTWLPHAAALLT